MLFGYVILPYVMLWYGMVWYGMVSFDCFDSFDRLDVFKWLVFFVRVCYALTL